VAQRVDHPEWPSGRSCLRLGILSAAAWLGSFLAWDQGSGLVAIVAVLLLILVGIVLSPVAATMSSIGLIQAKRAGEPIWQAAVGLTLSLPPTVFIVYYAVWGAIYD
jgi:hypothetical protein